MESQSYITSEEAAEILRVAMTTLARWRTEGDGPSYFKRRGRVLYTTAGIAEYMAAHEHVAAIDQSSAERPPAATESVVPDDEGWLTADEASATLRASAATLARWRTRGSGPEYIKRGGRIFYTPAAIRAFAESLTRTKTRG